MKVRILNQNKNNQTRKKFWSVLSVFVLLGAMVLSGMVRNDNASGLISSACRKSAECMAAVENEKAANAAAMSASSTASFYEAKVADLTTDIAAMRLKIADTEAQITELNAQIEETQKKLDSEQNALAELLVNMHFESDVEPISVLAGANSISDLAEKAARGDVAKKQIAAAATSIKEAKMKLEEDKAKVEKLLEEQQVAEKDLEEKRSEQQTLVEKYQNDAEAYRAQVLEAREAQRVAEKAYRDANPGLSGVYYDGADTYSSYIYDLGLEETGGARGYECPRDWDARATSVNGTKIGGLMCECVSYVGWKAYESYRIYLAYGNAYDWKWRAESDGYIANRTPEEGSIGWTSYGKYGHVFWVESVNSDGSIDVTDYNWNIDGRFTARTIAAGSVGSFYYIHLR